MKPPFPRPPRGLTESEIAKKRNALEEKRTREYKNLLDEASVFYSQILEKEISANFLSQVVESISKEENDADRIAKMANSMERNLLLGSLVGSIVGTTLGILDTEKKGILTRILKLIFSSGTEAYPADATPVLSGILGLVGGFALVVFILGAKNILNENFVKKIDDKNLKPNDHEFEKYKVMIIRKIKIINETIIKEKKQKFSIANLVKKFDSIKH